MFPLLIAIPVVLGGLAALVASRPSGFKIERRRVVGAPADVLHRLVNDFHSWESWSPWEKLDPTMKKDFAGPDAGPGASYHWVGNNKVGEGRMTITESDAPRSVTLRLEFMKPWKATNVTRFDFVPRADGTEVTWSMTGAHAFMAKAFSMFMDMDKMVGTDFEKGLAAMEEAARKG